MFELKMFVIVQCPKCGRLQTKRPLISKSRKSKPTCTYCKKTMSQYTDQTILFQTNDAQEAMHKIQELKRKIRQKCRTCGGEVRQYFLDNGMWSYECKGCGLPMKDCICSPYHLLSDVVDSTRVGGNQDTS